MLRNLFFPKTVAVIGASQRPASLGYHIMQNNINLRPTLFPVHPRYETVMGIKTCASVLDLPDDIDVAISVVGPDHTLRIAEECATAGVKFLIIVTSRFGEAARFREGKILEQKITAVARRSNIRIVGPNCIGVINLPYINSTFAPEYSPSTLEGLPIPPKGNVNIISESGSISGLVTAWLVEEGLGLNKLVNYGNGIDLTAVDFLEYFKTDEDCDVVGVYVEGIKTGRRFIEAAKSLNEEKPLIILKPGSELAGKAAQSHTGSVATNDVILDAALRQIRVQRAETYGQFCTAVKTHSMISDTYLRKSHLDCGCITNAGGLKVLLTESLRQHHVQESALSEFSPALIKTLEGMLPDHVTITNPLDVAGDAPSETYTRVMDIMLEQESIGCILTIPTFEPSYLRETLVEDTSTLMLKHKKPILVACIGGELADTYRDKFQKARVPSFSTPEELAYAYHVLRKRHNFLSNP